MIALVPMVFYLVEITGVKVQSGLYLTPLVFLAGMHAFLWSVRRGAYFQVLPEARDLLIEWMDNGILVLDRDGLVIDANFAAASLCNKPASELLGQALPNLFPQLSGVLDYSPLQDTIRTENTIFLKGKTQWLDFRITPLYKNTQDFSGYMLEMQDVTRRRQAEDALRESEQRYRQVIDGMIEGVVVQDADGSIIACNPNAELILDLPRSEILKHRLTSSIWKTIREDSSPLPGEEHPSMIALTTGQRQANVTIGLSLPDSKLRWLLFNSQPLIKENEDKPYAVVSTFVDITEDRKTQQILRDSEDMFRSLLESAPVAIIISDEEGHIQLMNTSAEQLFGYSRPELQGELIEKLIPERFQNGHIHQRNDFVKKSLSRPMGQGQELVARRKDGSEFQVDVGLNLIHTNNGTFVMSYLMDITARKKSEEALRQANEQLVHSLVELENHNRELVMLTEMGDMLQICASIEEAYTIVASYTHKLFPECSGALYMSIEDKTIYELTIAWGEQLPDELTFTADVCWALRRGRAHSADFTSNPLVCQHTAHLPKLGYTNSICVPMGALGEVIGLFHLRWKAHSKQRMIEQLAATVAEHITLSLSNLMLRENLRSQSIRDPLTGLFNRRYMDEAFNHELHRAVRRSHSIGVIMLDVDHFKTINDCFGHAHGDNLLIALANYLKTRLRGEDILCRYGGEEFAIILPDTTLESAIQLAEKLRGEIKAIEVDSTNQPYEPITISLGVAAFPEHGRNADELLRSADWALYQAKQKGRDRVMPAKNMT
jgi:diguanylate cyclase (GGDEF)-like protein/PAS domain S-box-containing protein